MPATGARFTGRKWGGGTLTFVCYSGSEYFLEFKILNFATGRPCKVQVRDLVRTVGIVAHFVPRGSVPGENSFYRAPVGGGEDKETCAGCPKQRYATGQLGKVQGRDRVGILERILERSCGYRARGVSIRGNSFYRRTWGTGRGGIAMWLNVVLTPG